MPGWISNSADAKHMLAAVLAEAVRTTKPTRRTRLRPPALGSFQASEPGVGGGMFEPLIEALR